MSIIAAIALAASGTTVVPTCSWDRPGVNPFMGDVVAAVDRYADIPAATRERLKARMAKRDYDEIVSIRRDEIQGQAQYASEIRDMHFGAGSVCGTVTRAKWTPTMEERGLVYCEDGQCILVPTVCRNVSRITRIAPRPRLVAAAVAPGDDPQSLLEMEPTSAGPAGTAAVPAAPANMANSFAERSGATLPGAVSSANPGSQVIGSGMGPTLISTAVPALTPGVVATSTTPTVPDVPTVPTTPTIPDPTLPATPLPAIPEPGTWALMLAGLAALSFIARRRSAHHRR